MIEEDSLVGGENQSNEDLMISSVRPTSFEDFIGQDDVKSQMALFIEAARSRAVSYTHLTLPTILLV